MGRAEVVDRLMAAVDRQIITMGDVEEELRFQEIDSQTSSTGALTAPQSSKPSQDSALQRLIDQALIRQQILLFPGIDATEAEIDSQMAELQRKAESSDAGWNQLLKESGIAPELLRERLRWQLQVVHFIDYRFRQFVVVDSGEVDNYYKNQFLEDLFRKGISQAPPLAEVDEKIRQILVEDKVNAQIEEWLASLRASAVIEIFH